jgi:hypothetical protein
MLKLIRRQLALRRYRRLRPLLESKYGWQVSYSKEQVSTAAAEQCLDLIYVDDYVAREKAHLDAHHHDSGHHHDHQDAHHHDAHHHDGGHNGGFDGSGHH